MEGSRSGREDGKRRGGREGRRGQCGDGQYNVGKGVGWRVLREISFVGILWFMYDGLRNNGLTVINKRVSLLRMCFILMCFILKECHDNPVAHTMTEMVRTTEASATRT